MPIGGIFQGLSQGSAQSLSQQLYFKQAQEQQNRETAARAQDIAFRNKQFDAQQSAANVAQQNWTKTHGLAQDRFDANVAHNKLMAGLRETEIANQAAYHKGMLAQDAEDADNMAHWRQMQEDLARDELASLQRYRDAQTAAKTREQIGRFMGGAADRVGKAIGAMNKNYQWRQEHELGERRVAATEQQAAIAQQNAQSNMIKAWSGLLEGTGTGTRGTGTGAMRSGLREDPLPARWSEGHAEAFVKTNFEGRFKDTLPFWFGGRMTQNEMMTAAQNIGAKAKTWIREAGLEWGSDQAKAALGLIEKQIMLSDHWKEIHKHGDGDRYDIENRFLQSLRHGAMKDVESDDIKNKTKSILGDMTSDPKYMTDYEKNAQILRHQKERRAGKSVMEEGLLGVALESAITYAEGARMFGNLMAHNIYKPLGKVAFGSGFGEPPPYPAQQPNAQDGEQPSTGIKRAADTVLTPPNTVAARESELQDYALKLKSMPVAELITELENVVLDPQKREILNVNLRNAVIRQVLQNYANQ